MTKAEKEKWSKDVKLFFNDCATVNEEFMLKHYITSLGRALSPALLVYDSCNSHITENVKKAILQKDIALDVMGVF